jgi:streptomycin 6-kinase
VRTADSLAADLSGDRVPGDLLASAQTAHAALCASQRNVRLLHGDLHQDNLLFDRTRGWLAVDPKGIVAEPEFEAGALFRNPWERPDLFRDPVRIRARLACLGQALPLDLARVRSWAFVQAVLAALWGIEDGIPAAEIEGCFVLARMLQETG